MKNFNEIYKVYSTNVFNYLNKKTGYRDSELARDLMQETMVKVHNHLDSFDGNKASMNTWIITIARNTWIDYDRKRRVDTQPINNFVDEDGNEMIHIEADENPLNDVINNQIGEGIQLAFSKLPDLYRQYADLFFNQQLSYDEIANELNAPIGTVKGTINRTRMLLKDLIKFDLS